MQGLGFLKIIILLGAFLATWEYSNVFEPLAPEKLNSVIILRTNKKEIRARYTLTPTPCLLYFLSNSDLCFVS